MKGQKQKKDGHRMVFNPQGHNGRGEKDKRKIKEMWKEKRQDTKGKVKINRGWKKAQRRKEKQKNSTL